MVKKLTVLLILSLASVTFAKYPQNNAKPRPLSKAELLALIAGEAQPENVASEIRSCGLRFAPSNRYRALLKTAGAEPLVLAALDGARVASSGEPDATRDDSALLLHLSNAGGMIRAGQLDDATNELNASLASNDGKLETGFVMGIVLFDRQQWEAASEIYSEILKRDSDFPQVHTRLSGTYYSSGNP
jgi:hypothetical protein